MRSPGDTLPPRDAQPGLHLRMQHPSCPQLASLLVSPTCPPVLHPCPTPLLAVPSPGAGLRGPVSPVALCCSPRDELGDLGVSTGLLPIPAGWVRPPAHPPRFSGPGHRGMGFTVSCAPFAVEPVPLLGQLGHGLPSQLPLVTGIWACRSHRSSFYPLETVNPVSSAAAQTTSPTCRHLLPAPDLLIAFVVDIASGSRAAQGTRALIKASDTA